MSVPNFAQQVRKLFETGLFNLRTEAGQGAFTDACVSMLNGLDPNWGHLIKKPGQTDVHGHGEDAALYKLPDGKAQAVDFIGSAGGLNPQPGWMVDEPRYTHADWADPTEHGYHVTIPAPVLVAPMPPYPGDEVFDAVGAALFADYARAGQAPNPQMGRWFGRTIYDWLAKNTATLDASIDKHGAEWRAILGLPPA